jgi:hypothetical protein
MLRTGCSEISLAILLKQKQTIPTNSIILTEVKVKLSINAEKAYGRLAVQRFLFLTQALDGCRSNLSILFYEGESVNRPQMDIKHKTRDIRTWKKYLFFDISSTNVEKLVPSLYRCVETRSIEVFRLLSQSLPQLVGDHLWHSIVHESISRLSCEPF